MDDGSPSHLAALELAPLPSTPMTSTTNDNGVGRKQQQGTYRELPQSPESSNQFLRELL
ncbi:hypothetical protein FRC11_012327, partial [Ceratobasidium sp. 423]